MIFHKTYFVLFFILYSLSSLSVNAQDTEDYEYSSEFIWGVTKSTNSGFIGGLVLKYGKAITANKFQTFGLEIVNVKHPQEFRTSSEFSGNFYIPGKSNYLYSVRTQYGREFIMFKKAPQQGIQINVHVSGGPTLGLVAPYLVSYGSSPVLVPYDPINNYSNDPVTGTGNILKGLSMSKINIGANLKSSLVFEFGTFKNNVTGFETGFLVEGFPKEVVIMPFAENRSIFTSAFITLFYGSRR